MPHPQPTPPHLLQRAAQGDAEALSALICVRKERVYQLATTLRAGRLDPLISSDAPDTAEALAEVSASAGGLQRWASSMGSTLQAMAQPQAVSSQPERDRPSLSELTPDCLLARWRLIFELHCAVAALPTKYREVLVLVDLEGLEQTQVAWLLNLGEAETRTRLRRARALVRERLLAVQVEKLVH